MWLKFYQKEHKLFPEQSKMFVSDKDAIKISKKLCRHFKFRLHQYYGVSFYGNMKNNNGHAYRWRIKIPHNCSILLLIHELAHCHNFQKYHNGHHTKRLMTTIKRMINYCKKMNYWNMIKND